MRNLVQFVSLGMVLLTESEIRSGAGGGKAYGLLELKKLGVKVPHFFTLRLAIGSSAEVLESEEPNWFRSLKGKRLAIRSSASLEDGKDASFAGQFESKLNVPGNWEAVRAAIADCLSATDSERVKSYLKNNNLEDKGGWFGVVVQEMVNASFAGVLFTADPFLPFRERSVCSFVAGLGEALVSGQANSTNLSWLHATGPNKNNNSVPENFPVEVLHRLHKESLRLQEKFGYPLDLEWALDETFTLYWLQARAITRLPEVHANSLDSSNFHPEDWFTLGNVGEMMPGAVSPMTQELFGSAVDAGLKDFARKSGVPESVTGVAGMRYIQVFYNRLFFNLSNLYDFCRYTGMNEKANIDLSIVGRPTEAPAPEASAGALKRGINFLRQVRYLNSAGSAIRKLNTLVKNFPTEWDGEISKLYLRLRKAQEDLNLAFCYHFATSSQSGSYYAALVRVISKNNPPEAQHHGMASMLLSQLGQVESIDPLKQLQVLADCMADLCTKGSMQEGDEPESNEKSSVLWARFLAIHGHRGFREAEFSTPGWGDDPDSLRPVLHQMVKQSIRGKNSGKVQKSGEVAEFKGKRPPGVLISLARKAVIRREQSKSACISLLNSMKRGYRKLGELLVLRGDLEKADQVFYLLQSELSELCSSSGVSYRGAAGAFHSFSKLAELRREAVEACASLSFEEVCKGSPLPVMSELEFVTDGEIRGIPVSRGKLEARVCLVNSLEEAGRLKPGEIMVTRITDIAWTPWFSIASGIVTEIGSPLSHGAVVAREYGIPAVVSVSGAMQKLRDGELVFLDGGTGEIVPLERG